MLSYRHAFHAGNFADVLKHCVLTSVLEYMTRKEKPFTYIDTHSGAGMYQLSSDYAQKTAEYKQGIAKIIDDDSLPAPLINYIELIKKINNQQALALYPGSPAIAKMLLRRQDSAHLFELHPNDFTLLSEYSQPWKKAFVKQGDGYQGLLGLLPPPSRRGVVLIDPPYELKNDYIKAVETIIEGYQKFATGTYLLWYPVVKRQLVEQMISNFIQSKVKNLLQIELCLRADTEEYGMTGTGLFVVNPPWQLATQMANVLPYLKEKLGTQASFYNLQQLINE